MPPAQWIGRSRTRSRPAGPGDCPRSAPDWNGAAQSRTIRGMSDVLVLFAHPAFNRSRVQRALLQAIDGLEGVHVRDLYALYPDGTIDVVAEQRAVEAHDLVVFQHPMFWYSCPALLKEWLDLVLQHGWAYGVNARALHGKRWLTAVSTGGSAESYGPEGINRYSVEELLRPFERTAALCGMEYLAPFVVHGAHTFETADDAAAEAARYRELVIGLRDGAAAVGGGSDAR